MDAVLFSAILVSLGVGFLGGLSIGRSSARRLALLQGYTLAHRLVHDYLFKVAESLRGDAERDGPASSAHLAHRVWCIAGRETDKLLEGNRAAVTGADE
jgi:hypothetical protein